MNQSMSLRFESKLMAPRERIWEWITSIDGISAEMRPLLRMTFPRHIRSLASLEIQPGVRLFRSYLLLFGILPIDYSDLSLLELRPGKGFIEQSPMGSMALWRHERYIEPCPSEPAALQLVDQLSFQPRMAPLLVAWFVRRFFAHRHKVLRANLEGVQQQAAPTGSGA